MSTRILFRTGTAAERAGATISPREPWYETDTGRVGVGVQYLTERAAGTLYVATNGDDATAMVGNPAMPYLTPAAAVAAAVAGELIVVFPGAYTCAASLAKEGVDWYFHPGASVSMSTAGTLGMWSDSEGSGYSVYGEGDFSQTCTGTAVTGHHLIKNYAGPIHFECRDLTIDSTDAATLNWLIYGGGEGTTIRCRDLRLLNGTSESACIYWPAEKLIVSGRSCIATKGRCVHVSSTPGLDVPLHVDFEEYVALAGTAIYASGSGDEESPTTQASWIRGNTLKAIGGYSVDNASASRVYVEVQKLFGPIATHTEDEGKLYIRADKVAAVANEAGLGATLLLCTAGAAWLQINQWDPAGFTGPTMKVTGGFARLLPGEMVTGACQGFAITGGKARLNGMTIDASGNSASNPITKSGGVLVLQNSVLVAEGTRDSIEAATAQDVVAYGSYANKAVDGNVTLTVAGLTVDADVI